MKKIVIGICLLVISLVAVAMTNSADVEFENDYVVHEWGTFTSVSGSDGELLDGLFIEEERLPDFVQDLRIPVVNGMKFQRAGFPRHDLNGVNIKMETPVIYFYSDKEREVDVNVKFKGGLMNQWYPAATGKRFLNMKSKGKSFFPLNDLDFRKDYSDALDWRVKVLDPKSYLSYTSPQSMETPTWVNPRFTDANMLQIGKDREKFIFYRGLARFQQPFRVTAQNSSQITLQNTGSDPISFALVYEYTKDRKAKVWWAGKLEGNQPRSVEKNELDVDKSINSDFLKALVEAGLYEKEAKAMLETWRHSYFENEGLRVFWVVPRKFTDEILPLKLNPLPKKLERVLVGRTEILTPEFEQKIVKDFTTNTTQMPFWYNNLSFEPGFIPITTTKADRYFKAWQNRVKQLTKGKQFKFDFLKQVSGHELPLGEFYIEAQKDKYGHLGMKYLDSNVFFLNYFEKKGKVDGEVSYSFESDEARNLSKLTGARNLDRLAVFNMQEGVITGECKIFQIERGKEKVLLETKIFKDGKVL